MHRYIKQKSVRVRKFVEHHIQPNHKEKFLYIFRQYITSLNILSSLECVRGKGEKAAAELGSEPRTFPVPAECSAD